LIAQNEAKLRERCALLASGKAWKMRMKKHGPVYTNCAPSNFTLRMLLQKWLSKINRGHVDMRGFWSDWNMIRLYNKLVTRVYNETREIADVQTSDEEFWESDQDLKVVDDGEGGTDEDEGGTDEDEADCSGSEDLSDDALDRISSSLAVFISSSLVLSDDALDRIVDEDALDRSRTKREKLRAKWLG
jgi:hypothetical protein